jgi:hypothetical protein
MSHPGDYPLGSIESKAAGEWEEPISFFFERMESGRYTHLGHLCADVRAGRPSVRSPRELLGL